MRKKFNWLIFAILVVGLLIPISSISAYTGGLLDGKSLTVTNPRPGDPRTTTAVTDNDTGTRITLVKAGSLDAPEGLEYTFDDPMTITSFKLYLTKPSSGSPGINVYYYDSQGKVIYSQLVGTENGKEIKHQDVKDVKRVKIAGASSNFYVDAREFNVYGYSDTITAPTDLTAIGDDSKVTLNWSPVSNALHYNIKRSTSTGGPYEQIADSVTETTYNDLGVVNGTTYYYIVTPFNYTGEGQRSNEASATPRASEVTLDIESAKDKVFLNETFTVQAVLNHATNIYAEDFTVKYDTMRFQLVKVEAADNMGLFHNGTVSDDTVRLITASLGKDYGINDKGTLVHFTFKAIGLGKGKIDATKGKIADNGTTEVTLSEENCGEKEIEVIVTDFTLKDLGFLGYNYTEDKNNLTNDLQNLLGSTGNVTDVDLVELTNAILANPNYDFNK